MRLVDDHEIPARTEQAFAGVFDERHPGNGSDDLVSLLPRVLAVVCPQHVAANDFKLLAELVRHFALPLKREICGCDDQHTADEAARFEFLQEQAGHNRFAGPWIVGQKKANARQLHEVTVDGFKLMRQWIDASD